MNKFYFHYFSYLDGLSPAIKYKLFEEPLLGEQLYSMSGEKKISEFLKYRGIKEKEADYAGAKLSDGRIKKQAEKEFSELNYISFYSFSDAEYPDRLRHIYNPPLGLYVRGKLPEKELPCLAVIGSRACSEYGAYWAERYTEDMCEKGVQIISGMAEGIDGIAGRISVKYKGLSFAVLGSGLNKVYPEKNKDLYEALWKNGSLISEYPPNTRPEPFRFPYRNRIISGLSDAVFVAEAAIKSGSHITAYFALEQGKDVYALPGRVDDALSRGTNNLIKSGAYPALASEDIFNGLQRFH